MKRVFETDEFNITKGRIVGRKVHDVDYDTLDYFTNSPEGQYPLDGSFLDPEGPYRWKAIHAIRRILKHKPDTKTVLDVGAGPCHIAYWVNKMGLPIDVTSYDISESLFSYIKSKNMLFGGAIIGDIRDLKDVRSKYDTVVFADILEHIEPVEARDALATAYSLLNPNGLLYLNIPNRNSWSHKSYRSPGHIWLPSTSELISLFKSLGFKKEMIKTITRGFPGSKLYTKITGKDFEFPYFGRSIIVFGKKLNLSSSHKQQ